MTFYCVHRIKYRTSRGRKVLGYLILSLPQWNKTYVSLGIWREKGTGAYHHGIICLRAQTGTRTRLNSNISMEVRHPRCEDMHEAASNNHRAPSNPATLPSPRHKWEGEVWIVSVHLNYSKCWFLYFGGARSARWKGSLWDGQRTVER